MDIRRKTTYLSRGPAVRQGQAYSSFFQSAQKKYYNIDPESGMHLVGPMFELTACAELKGDEDDFTTGYPDSSTSFGPTICSFGLKYNDHNYAMASGLTPPSMAPHLMDSHHSRSKFSSDLSCARAIFSENAPGGGRRRDRDEPDFMGNTEEFPTSEVPNSVSPSGQEDTGSYAERYYRDVAHSPRFGKSGYEQIEMRYEPELKVIEVPEELAVSPTQLSDLDSDTDENFPPGKATKVGRPATLANLLDGSLMNGIVWTKLRCTCSRGLVGEPLIQCPTCNFFQHVRCMENHYNVSLPNLTVGYVCPRCGHDGDGDTTPDDVRALQGAHLDTGQGSLEASKTNSESGSQKDTDCAIGGQYVDATVDKAIRLGLISGSLRLDSQLTAKPAISSYSMGLGKFSERNSFKEHDHKVGPAGVDWDRLNELSRCARRPPGDTNVNLRVPSPPRASKRKQDLSTKSYKEIDIAKDASTPEKRILPTDTFLSPTSEVSSASATPISTPTSTPRKLPFSDTSPALRFMTPGSDGSSSSGMDSPLRPHHRGDKRRHKFERALFTNNFSPDKRGLGPRSHPLKSAWAKDYQEADTNAYSKALLDCIEQHVASGVEHNHRIPPIWLTRSPLCRVVLFDHDDKGLEASARLSPNEVVIEVRGSFLLMEEYEHYVDPSTEYNRYVMFYRGFSDRAIVIDASQYGNSARFMRRSCVPNCRLDHCLVQDKLQMVIRTTSEVMPGTELTLPFNLDYRACRYPVDCACGRSRCLVLKWRRKLVRNKVVPNLDYGKYIESQLRVLSKPLTQESPNNKGQSYDPITLSGSPILRSVTTSQLPRSPASFHSATRGSESADKKTTATLDSDSDTNLRSPRSQSANLEPSTSRASVKPDEDSSTFQPIITTRRQAAVASRVPYQ